MNDAVDLPEKLAFSVRDFCALHDITRSTFYVLKARGEAPDVIRVGRRTLISKEAALRWREDMSRPWSEGAPSEEDPS